MADDVCPDDREQGDGTVGQEPVTGGTTPGGEHATGTDQAAENREKDPPA